MRTRVLLAVLVLLGSVIPAPASAQESSEVQLNLAFQLDPGEGQVHVDLRIEDPGPLKTIQLNLGQLESLEGKARLEGAWSEDEGTFVADLEETPQASASWTSTGRIRAQTLEGEGHTSYVGDDFAVVKAGDMVPNVRYSFPQSSPPSFSSHMTVSTPDDWTVMGPWETQGDGFQLDRPLPRGFLAAGASLDEARLGQDGDDYQIVRVAGAQEDGTTDRILLQARSYLGGIYGRTAHEQFIVVAPDPMFRGGLGSPAGVFLHDNATGRVVAHEMVHAYQGFRFSRAPGAATVWLGEGSAVVHGALLEVAAGVQTREEARSFLQDKARTARQEHAVDLTSAVYGSGNEQAAYTKGAVVVTALDDRIREATDDRYTLADVLRELNRKGAASDGFTVDTETLITEIRNVTGLDAQPFFDEFVFDSDVPELGSIFPGQASVRILGTDPDPPVAGEPFDLEVELRNLDTASTTVEASILVDGTQRGELVATLESGETARASPTVEALERGTYTVKIEGDKLGTDSREVTVPAPADPSANVTVWPPEPLEGENVTVGARLSNTGEAPYRGPVRITLDGDTVLERGVHVPSGGQQTIARTLPPLGLGNHDVRVLGPQGDELGAGSLTVAQPETANAPLPGVAALVTTALLAALLAPARVRR